MSEVLHMICGAGATATAGLASTVAATIGPNGAAASGGDVSDFAIRLAWQGALLLAAGLLAAVLLRTRPPRAHTALVLAMAAALLAPMLSIATRSVGLGLWSMNASRTSVATGEGFSTYSPSWSAHPPPFADQARVNDRARLQTSILRTSSADDPIPPGVNRTAVSAPAQPPEKPAIRSSPSAVTTESASVLDFSWLTYVLGWSWLVLSLATGVRFAGAIGRTRTIIAKSQVVSQRALLAALDRSADRAGLRRRPLLRASALAPCPVVWAWSRRPSIVVPEARIDAPDVDWSAVFAHELAHLSRRDHVWQLMSDVVCVLLPWNPLAWRMRRLLTVLSDESCDAHAVARGESPTGLAEALLQFAPLRRAACMPAAVGEHGLLHGRIVRLLGLRRESPHVGRTWCVGAVMLAAGLTVFLALAQARAASSARPSDAQAAYPSAGAQATPSHDGGERVPARPAAPPPAASSQPRLLSSDTIPDGGIDAREAHAFGDPSKLTGLSVFEFTFDDSSSVTPDRWAIAETGDAVPPDVTDVERLGRNRVRLKLDRPITAGEWTTIVFKGAQTRAINIGFLPGDVDQSGTVSTYDISALVDCLNGQSSCADYQKDIDRTGLANGNDITRLIDLMQNVSEDPRPWLNESLSPAPVWSFPAASPPAVAANLLKNADMESGKDQPDAWARNDAVPGVEYAWDRSVGHGTSQSSLRLRKTAENYFPVAEWYQELACAGRPAKLDVSAFFKVEALTKAVLDVQFIDSKDQWSHKWVAYAGAPSTEGSRLTHDWRAYGGRVDVPADTRKLRVAVQLYGPGTIWVDDATAQLTHAAPESTGSSSDASRAAPGGVDAANSVETLLRDLEKQVRLGETARIFTTATDIAEQRDSRAIPTLIGLIDSDNSYWTVYGVGYFGLAPLTGVTYNDYHHGPWWRTWWEANKSRYPAAADVPIPDCPLTTSGTAFRKNPPAPESILLAPTTDQLLERLVGQVTAGAPGNPWQTATLLADAREPRAIPAMIGLIATDNTYDTVYGIGYFGLKPLTGVEYDEGHDGAWWKTWWKENRTRFPSEAAALDVPVYDSKVSVARARRERDMAVAAAETADVPAMDLQADGDPDKRYILMGPSRDAAAPDDGYRLLLVLPGGDGSADFSPFIKRIFKQALPPSYLVAELVAPQWSADQKDNVVWPTGSLPWTGMKFSTEDFVEAVVRDVSARFKVDPRYVFTLSWSSGGPAAYDVALRESTPITGSFVAMSIFPAQRYAHLERAKGRNFYILHSPDDQLIPMAHPQRASDLLSANGANVKFASYAGGHGWSGDVYGMIREGVTWLESRQASGLEPGAPATKP